jgi:hypothetical protein
MGDAGECIPVQALRYLRGDRQSFAALPRADREIVMVTARTIGERAKKLGGLIALAGVPHLDRDGNPDYEADSAMPKEADEMTDLNSMTSEQLRELAARAHAAAKEREKAEKQAASAKPTLLAERHRCMERVGELNEALAALDRGESVDLNTLGVRVGPAGKRQASETPLTRQATAWTPERRARQGERMKGLLAEARAKKAKGKAAA